MLLLLFLLFQGAGQAAGRVVRAGFTGVRNTETGESLLLGPLLAEPRHSEGPNARLTQWPRPADLLQVLQGSHHVLHLVPEAVSRVS